MTKFYFNGCSHSIGEELKNESDRWSNVVCRHFDAEEHNKGLGGGSNDRMLRHLFEDVTPGAYDHVFIMWTHPERTEFFDSHAITTGEDPPVEPYVPVKLNRVLFIDNGLTNSDKRVMLQKEFRLALEHYYDQIHTKKQQQIKLFTHIFQAQRYLDATGIPYTMSFAFPQNYRIANRSDFIKLNGYTTAEIDRISANIDWTKFIEDDKTSYMLWAQQHGYDIGPMLHPLEEANFKWGQKVIKHILDSDNAN